MSPLFFKIMKKLVNRIDPKLEKYRPAVPAFTPKTKEELILLLKRTPESVLSKDERKTISSVMSFSEKPVSRVMLPREKMTFVHEHDFLGPLMLDKLYKSGFEHFPVVGASGRITGLIHTKELNSLKVQDNDRAVKYLDENIYYILSSHTLEMALAAFMRTNCYFFLVIDKSQDVVGLITYKMVLESMFGKQISDDFDADLDIKKVAERTKSPKI